MIKHLAIIPARKGSKGLPMKNKRLLAGKPLVAYSIEAALGTEDLDILVASDDSEILDIAHRYGVSSGYVRHEHVSTDEASTSDLVVDIVDWLGPKIDSYSRIVLLQPTSPFRTAEDIRKGLELAIDDPRPVVGVSQPWGHPEEIVRISSSGGVHPLLPPSLHTRRQSYADEYYFINGAFYSYSAKRVRAERKIDSKDFIPLLMSDNNSVDIDTLRDFVIAEALVSFENQAFMQNDFALYQRLPDRPS